MSKSLRSRSRFFALATVALLSGTLAAGCLSLGGADRLAPAASLSTWTPLPRLFDDLPDDALAQVDDDRL